MALSTVNLIRLMIHDRAAPQIYADDDIDSVLALHSPDVHLLAAIYLTAADLLDGVTAHVAQSGFAKVKIEGEVEVDTRPSSGGSAQSQASQYRLLAANIPYSAAAELSASAFQVLEMLENQFIADQGLDVYDSGW